jgi:hypothetical protein
MKSVVWQARVAFLFFDVISWVYLPLGVAFVGAAGRSLARHSRSELGDRPAA